jgi:hypothetical protein
MKLTDAELAAELEGRAASFSACCPSDLTLQQSGQVLGETLKADAALLLPELEGDEPQIAAQIRRALQKIEARNKRWSRMELGYLLCWGALALGLASKRQKPKSDQS